jgi:hypothetical protein
MYDNVGNKIKVLAQILGWLGLIGGGIVWIVLLAKENPIGWVGLGAGIVWFLFSWFLYGFGQLVQDVSESKDILISRRHETKPEQPKQPEQPKEIVTDELPDL